MLAIPCRPIGGCARWAIRTPGYRASRLDSDDHGAVIANLSKASLRPVDRCFRRASDDRVPRVVDGDAEGKYPTDFGEDRGLDDRRAAGAGSKRTAGVPRAAEIRTHAWRADDALLAARSHRLQHEVSDRPRRGTPSHRARSGRSAAREATTMAWSGGGGAPASGARARTRRAGASAGPRVSRGGGAPRGPGLPGRPGRATTTPARGRRS